MKKTQKSFRKKALLSSLSMLLVATVAVGSATFAWFTSSTTATADKLSVKTVKASELKVSDDTNDWTDQLHYNTVGKVLKPASSADGVNWFAAKAASKSASTAKEGSIEKLSNLDGYVFKNQLNVSNAGGAAVNNVKINFTLSETQQSTGAGYLRLALVAADKKGTDAAITGTFTDGVYAKAVDSAEALTGTALTNVTSVSAKSGASVSFDVGLLGANGSGTESKYFNLYVWFEGQDTDCKDANAGNEMPEITFTVSGDTVETTT